MIKNQIKYFRYCLFCYIILLVGDTMDYEFKSLKELYDRITPALTSKKDELKKYSYIKS